MSNYWEIVFARKCIHNDKRFFKNEPPVNYGFFFWMMNKTNRQIVLVDFVIDLKVPGRSFEKGVFFLGVFIVERAFIFDIIERQNKNQANAENHCNKNYQYQ